MRICLLLNPSRPATGFDRQDKAEGCLGLPSPGLKRPGGFLFLWHALPSPPPRLRSPRCKERPHEGATCAGRGPENPGVRSTESGQHTTEAPDTGSEASHSSGRAEASREEPCGVIQPQGTSRGQERSRFQPLSFGGSLLPSNREDKQGHFPRVYIGCKGALSQRPGEPQGKEDRKVRREACPGLRAGERRN